jgi:hypothetical protein
MSYNRVIVNGVIREFVLLKNRGQGDKATLPSGGKTAVANYS